MPISKTSNLSVDLRAAEKVLNAEFKRLEPLKGTLGSRIIERIKMGFQKIFYALATGRVGNDQACHRLNGRVKQLSKSLILEEKKMQFEGVEKLSKDVKMRQSVEKLVVKMGEFLAKLPKNSKEQSLLISNLSNLDKHNRAVIEKNQKRIEAREKVVHKRDITPEEKEALKGKQANLRAVLKPQQKYILGGLKKRQRKADALQKALIGLTSALSKMSEYLSEDEKKELTIKKGSLHKLSQDELMQNGQHVLALLNRVYFSKGAAVPAELKNGIDVIQEHLRRLGT